MANNNSSYGASTRTIIRYKECLHNHAIKIMGYCLDGCGEFVPSGKEGTPEFVICAACFCHRSFHKKVKVKLTKYSTDQVAVKTHLNSLTIRDSPTRQATKTQARKVVRTLNQGRIQTFFSVEGKTPNAGNELKMLPTTSQEMDVEGNKKPRMMRATQEQKEKLQAFAEKRGWKLLKYEEKNEDVNQFCSEIGITVQYLKNWISNNRRKIALKQALIET